LQVASHLLNIGARHQEINKNILRNKSLSLLKLWGRAFERLRYNSSYDLAFTVITSQDITECGAESESASGLSNFFNDLAGAKASLVLIEQPDGTIKGSLRTTRDDVDVAKLAKTLGGGGHQKAAGFSVSGRLVYNEGNWFIRPSQ
jgi:phosphoesterase RecJ-like protein